MKFKRNLRKLALTGALVLGITGCSSNHLEYHFKGEIEGEEINCSSTDSGYTFLKTTKEDGNIISYRSGKDLTLEYIEITVEENTTRYSADSSNPVCKEILEKAQLKFDSYLEKITEIQTAPLNDVLENTLDKK
ncbi:hypothetical protein HOE04_01650 [archaeon]|mgnify:CR=1 FL=1|jgi:hypothetical protein|nr:hypothetical protein [archaeon]